jgi:NADP-dependent 3-hydroxy acid dehydrogenase YdfG
MNILHGKVAVVTGAGSGIGRATALSLWSQGAHVCLVGRTQSKLEETARAVGEIRERFTVLPVDLTVDQALDLIMTSLEKDHQRVDILVHSAGVIHKGGVGEADIREFDFQYQANVRAPFRLTQALLPLLKLGPGQVVFVNSSVGLRARGGISQFSATQHALKALADSLRDEVNQFGIRVLSVYPGRTATPRQARLYEMDRQEYRPELLLQPQDVASIILFAVSLPRTAELTDISIRPMRKSY